MIARRAARRAKRAWILAAILGCEGGPSEPTPVGASPPAPDVEPAGMPPAASPRGDAAQDRRARCLRQIGEVPPELAPVAAALCSELSTQDVVGAQIAAVGPTGPVLSWAAGRRCATKPEPLTTDHRMRIGSVTKMLTAATVLHLADEGRVDVDASLDALNPPLPIAGADRIRVRDLLAHTAGLTDVPPAPHRVALDPDALARELSGDGPVTPPGTRWAYANVDYVLLGLWLQAHTGDALAEITRTTLLGTRGGFTPLSDDACGHLRDGDGWRPYSTTEDLELFAFGARYANPAGGVIVSAEDLARVLPRIARRLAAEPSIATGGPDDEAYGAGVRSRATSGGARIYVHTGHTGDFTAEAWWVPEAELALVVIVSGPRPLRATALSALQHLADVSLSASNPAPAPAPNPGPNPD